MAITRDPDMEEKFQGLVDFFGFPAKKDLRSYHNVRDNAYV